MMGVGKKDAKENIPFEKRLSGCSGTGHTFQNASHLNAALLRQVMLFKIPAL
jgi:hypothetical protein